MMAPNNEYCVQESGINPNRVRDIFEKMDMSIDRLDCFARCHYQRLGFVDFEEKFYPKVMASTIHRLSEGIAEHCIHKFKQEKNFCQRVLLIVKCNLNLIAKQY
uniref:Uncharacterized protein n=2 Tax=Photinus pyralis TaxID=7054 RepID=A0A1Y1MAQ0_PHOPY